MAKKNINNWLDEFDTPQAQNGIEGTMAGLTDKGFNYNGAWGGPSMQVGGSLPGSVGFTYARTGSTPSEGPYAKKTMPSAQNGMEMSYYQNGLDWKPRNISENGSEIPKAQIGKRFAPPAVESTAIRMFNPLSGKQFSTATTGMTPEQMEETSRSMGRVKKAEREEVKKRVAERKAAKSAVDKGTAFTFPTGETKKYEDMNWREKAYVSGQAVQQRGRINEDDEAWYDVLNPISFITDIAGGLGTAPYEAQQSNSNLPYLSAIATPLIGGALGFDPLGSAMKVPGRVAQSMESGLLSNLKGVAKGTIINPWEKGYGYRMIGNEAGLKDAFESGILRSKQELTKKFGISLFGEREPIPRALFNPDKPLTNYGNWGNNKWTNNPYVARVPKNNPNLLNEGYGLSGNVPITDPGVQIFQKKWWGYKEVPKSSSSYGNIGPINSENSGSINFSNYLTQEEAVKARAQRMLEQQDKWIGQDDEFLKAQFETAHLRHDPAADYNPEALGTNRGDMTLVSKYAPLSDANKARIAAHETGHYYSNAVDEANEWNSLFDFENLSPKTRAYLKGTKDGWQAKYPNQSPPPRTSGLNLWKPKGVPGGNEIRERAAQLKDYIAQKNNIPLNKNFTVTEAQLDDAITNYTNDTGLDNVMSEMLSSLKDKKGFLKAINKYALGVTPIVTGAAALQKQKKGGVIKDNMGYWNPDNWGKVVEIDSPNITMQGVNQPLVGISDEGDVQYMEPGKDYKFKGKKVREIPMAQFGCVGENCRGKSWRPTLSDKSGGGGGDMSSVGGAPVTAKELEQSGYESLDKKKIKQYTKDLQGQFPGLSESDVARAAGDSARIRAKLHNFAKTDELIGKYNEALKQGQGINEAHKYFPYSDYFYGYYRPMIMINPVTGQPIPPNVPQILSAHASPEEYRKTVEKNYKKKNGGWLDEL